MATLPPGITEAENNSMVTRIKIRSNPKLPPGSFAMITVAILAKHGGKLPTAQFGDFSLFCHSSFCTSWRTPRFGLSIILSVHGPDLLHDFEAHCFRSRLLTCLTVTGAWDNRVQMDISVVSRVCPGISRALGPLSLATHANMSSSSSKLLLGDLATHLSNSKKHLPCFYTGNIHGKLEVIPWKECEILQKQWFCIHDPAGSQGIS